MSGEHPWPSNALLVVRAGSHAYGTNQQGSDEDYRGIIPASRSMLLGLDSWDTQFERSRPDVVLYTLPKFVKLGIGANPNIMDALFAPDDIIVQTSPIADELRAMAPTFLSKKVYKTFTGYAHGQLKRLRSPGGRHGAHRRLIEAYGYDTKNAMHLVRLYRMGYEALTEGVIRVRRPDREELMSILHGAWSLKQVEAFTQEMEKRCARAYTVSSLPNVPDMKAIVEWLMDAQHRLLDSYGSGF